MSPTTTIGASNLIRDGSVSRTSFVLKIRSLIVSSLICGYAINHFHGTHSPLFIACTTFH